MNLLKILRDIKLTWDNYWKEYEDWFETLTPEEKIIFLMSRNKNSIF